MHNRMIGFTKKEGTLRRRLFFTNIKRSFTYTVLKSIRTPYRIS